MLLVPLLLLPLLAFLNAAGVLLNVTIDDTSSMISYAGAWEASSTHLSGLDYGGSHTLSSDSTANATFKFTGVAVYYLSPRWPYAVNTRLGIDGGSSTLVNLTDPSASTTPIGGSESATYSVAWSATGLANKSHTVLVTYGNYIVVDGFIFTVDDGTLPISSSSSSSSASASKSSSLTSSATLAASSGGASTVPSHNGLTIGLATALPLAALIAAALLAFAFCQRRRRLHRRPTRTKFVLDDSGPAQPVYAAVYPGNRRDTPIFDEHTQQMSDVSSSRVHSPYPSISRSNPAAPDDAQRFQAFPVSSHTHLSSGTASISSYPRTMELPPGAASPVVPDGYADYADRTRSDNLSSRSAISGAGSSRPFAVNPLVESESGSDLRRGISRPPAYSK